MKNYSILKGFLRGFYYKIFIESEEKKVNSYLLLTQEQIQEIMDSIPYFSTTLVCFNECLVDEKLGISHLVADLGYRKYEHFDVNRDEMDRNIMLAVKKWFAENKRFSIVVHVNYLTETKLDVIVAVSNYGVRYIQKLKSEAIGQEIEKKKEISLREEKLALAKEKLRNRKK